MMKHFQRCIKETVENSKKGSTKDVPTNPSSTSSSSPPEIGCRTIDGYYVAYGTGINSERKIWSQEVKQWVSNSFFEHVCNAESTETMSRNTVPKYELNDNGTETGKQTLIYGTWNISRIRNKTEDVREIEKYRMDFVVPTI